MAGLSWFPFVGTSVPVGAKIVSTEFAIRSGWPLAWVVVAAVALAMVVAWSYRRLSADLGWRRWVLATFRILVISLLLLMLLRPAVRVTFDRAVRRTLLVLIDGSQSMSVTDRRIADADVKRVGLADGRLDPAKGLDQPAVPTTNPTRAAVVRSALANNRLMLLKRLGESFDVDPYLFSDGLTELSGDWPNRLTADGSSTPLGDRLRELLAKNRGRAVAAVVVVTDGQNNAGQTPRAAAEMAKNQGVPVYAWGVGVTDSRDVVVQAVYSPELGFKNEKLPVAVRLAGLGLAGQAAVLHVKIGTAAVVDKPITFTGDEQAATVVVTPTEAGRLDVTASIDVRPDEAVPTNNSKSITVKVTDKPARVLLVDQRPRWEFKYLQAALRGERFSVRYLLQDQTAAADDKTYLKSFPTTREELFDTTDLVVLGDVDPAGFSTEQMNILTEFVFRQGGGLLMIAGHVHGIREWSTTPLGAVLPVTPGDDAAAPTDAGVRVLPTAEGKRSPMLRLIDDEQASADAWQRLTPLYWVEPVKPKPGGQTLLAGRSPVLVLQPYGAGQSMYLATDNAWRWRKNNGEPLYAAFWMQLVQRMALPHLLGESRQSQLSADKDEYNVGDRVVVYARLYGAGYAPLNDPTAAGSVTTDDGKSPLTFALAADQPGVYRAEFLETRAGRYTVGVDRDSKASVVVDVKRSSLEMTRSSMNEAGLREMTTIAGGRFFREEDLNQLPDVIKGADPVERSSADVELWSTPIYLAVLLTLAIAEWGLRKWWQLK